MNCPDCKVPLNMNKKLGQGVWLCAECGYTWFILKLRITNATRGGKNHADQTYGSRERNENYRALE